jgi:adenylate kinase family enzyme
MDDQIVRLIEKRILLADCKKNGWILDGMPANKNQA